MVCVQNNQISLKSEPSTLPVGLEKLTDDSKKYSAGGLRCQPIFSTPLRDYLTHLFTPILLIRY